MGEHAPKLHGGGSRPARRRAPQPKPAPAGPDATDAAREFAAEHQIDLETVTGTGADGRITKDDVQSLVDQPVEQD